MTVFKYSGRTKTGVPKKGTIDANNKQAALAKLREQGINAREIEESKNILHVDLNIGGKVKGQDFVIYCRQFATLIRAGVSIIDATNILAEQSSNKTLSKTLSKVAEDVRGGITFSDAAAKYPKVFPDIFVNMLRSAEATGSIDETLDRLATTLEKQYSLKKKVQSTMTYPLILMALTVIVVIFLLVFIVPMFVSTFEDMGAELPFITIFTLKLSALITKFWWVLFIILIGIIVTFNYLFKNNEKFNYSVHYALFKMPLFGSLFQKSALARLTRTLASLFSSAVPILQALNISEKVSGNPVLGKVVVEARESLEKGSTLTEPLEKSWIFPPLVTSMTKIGENTGSLDFMLEKVADFYEDEVDRAVDTLKSLIEPAMILILAFVVGFIVASIFLPMFSLYEQI